MSEKTLPLPGISSAETIPASCFTILKSNKIPETDAEMIPADASKEWAEILTDKAAEKAAEKAANLRAEKAADRAAEKTVNNMMHRMEPRFENIDKNFAVIQAEQNKVRRKLEEQDEAIKLQNKRIDMLHHQQQQFNQGKRASSEVASNFSFGTARESTRPRYDEKDPEKLVAGEWPEDTPIGLMRGDVEKVLKTFGEKTGLDFKIDAIYTQEGFGKYCSFKLADNKGDHERKQAAWLFSDRFFKEKKTTNYVTTGGSTFWISIHRPKDERDIESVINCGLRALHLYREANAIGDRHKLKPEDMYDIKVVMGRFEGEKKGVRWMSKMVADLDEVEMKLTWDKDTLSKCPELPVAWEALKPFVEQAEQERSAKRR